MAYLNVRDRRIETKIAYLGAAARASSFDQLRTARSARFAKVEAAESDTGEALSMAWTPPESDRFRDCDVRVMVVSPRGSLLEASMQDALREADGVVLMPDADSSLEAVRDVLAKADRRDVPVVVHDTDKGAAETLEDAVNQVLQAMRTANNDSAAPAIATPAGDGGGHPLLAALRQVLRDTVREHVEELEARISERIITHLVTHLEDGLVRSEARVVARVESIMMRLTQRVAELDVATSGLATRVDGVSGAVERVRVGVDMVEKQVTAVEKQVASVEKHVAAVEKQVAGADPRARLESLDTTTRQRSQAVEEAVKRLQAEVSQASAATEEKNDAVAARVDELLTELRSKKKGWFA